MDMRTSKAAQAATTRDDLRWAAVVARDPRADGRFFYSVKTTRVYCRPSCAARPARPENVAFHDTAVDAERAGFRPCKRCRPERPASPADEQAALVAGLCRFIENAERPPTLAQLAEQAGLSTYHLHRVFKQVTGVTPKAYAAANRAQRVRQELQRGSSVTEAIYGAGYNSNGRFYEESDALLGMTPGAFRAGGADVAIRFAVGQCSLGAILVAQSERGICAIAIGDDPEALVRELQDRFPRARLIGGDAAFERTVAQVVGFVEAPGVGLDLPLDVRGTAFQQRVWQALREIPAGSTASYTDIAQRIGVPNAVRAVAQAWATARTDLGAPMYRAISA